MVMVGAVPDPTETTTGRALGLVGLFVLRHFGLSPSRLARFVTSCTHATIMVERRFPWSEADVSWF
jgi:hypothetical protein